MTDKIRPVIPFSDKLLPTPVDPTMHYVDYDDKGDTLWQVDIRCFHDKDSTLSQTKNHQGKVLSKTTYNSLDELTTEVYHRRPPPRISVNNIDKQKFFIAHSATNQYDLVSSITPSTRLFHRIAAKAKNPHLSERRLQDELQSQHILLKNGLRAKVITEDGIVTLRNTISGSWDRESPNLQMARRIAPAPNGEADPRAPSDFYTGRPDTKPKARELAEMIFFGELESRDPKGIEQSPDGVYNLNFVINSLISTSPLYALNRPNAKGKGAEQEQDYFKNEREALQALEKDGVMEFEHPVTGAKYKVRVKPMLFANQVNFMGRAEKVLSSAVSGEKETLETSREGWKNLKSYAESRLPRMYAPDAERVKKLIELIETSLNARDHARLKPEEELLCNAMLCRLLKLPHVVHCKSSTDRTSFGIMITTLRQWENLGLQIPENIISLLDDEDFKELFMANWEACHAITRNARGPHGVLPGETLDHEKLGLATERGLAMGVLPARFLPARYLKDYSTLDGAKEIYNLIYKALYKKSGNLAYWSGFWARLLTPIVFILGCILRGLFEFMYPYASDLPFKPAKEWRKLGLVVHAILTIFYRIIVQYIIGYNNDFWYGGMRPPENGFIKWLLHYFVGPFVLAKTACSLFTTPVQLAKCMPDKVIDESKVFVKNRRLIANSPYQKRFEEAHKAVPAEADPKFVSQYNAKFEQRFLDEARPVQEIIYADMLEENLRNYQSIDELYKQFAYEVKRGMKYTIDGRVFDHEDRDYLARDIFTYLKIRCTDRRGRVDQKQLWRCIAACQQGTAAAARRHTEHMLLNPQNPLLVNPEDLIAPQQPLNDPGSIEISTLGDDWTLQMKSKYELLRGPKGQEPPHARFDVTTSVNVTSGQADILWTLQDLDDRGTKFIPFGPLKDPEE